MLNSAAAAAAAMVNAPRLTAPWAQPATRACFSAGQTWWYTEITSRRLCCTPCCCWSWRHRWWAASAPDRPSTGGSWSDRAATSTGSNTFLPGDHSRDLLLQHKSEREHSSGQRSRSVVIPEAVKESCIGAARQCIDVSMLCDWQLNRKDFAIDCASFSNPCLVS